MTPLTPTTRKAAAMSTPRPPAKPWRIIIPGEGPTDYRGQQAAYDHLNAFAAEATIATRSRLVTVWHWEDGDWRLYERAVITENGWEPA